VCELAGVDVLYFVALGWRVLGNGTLLTSMHAEWVTLIITVERNCKPEASALSCVRHGRRRLRHRWRVLSGASVVDYVLARVLGTIVLGEIYD
jgi:hypothetical protein